MLWWSFSLGVSIADSISEPIAPYDIEIDGSSKLTRSFMITELR